MVSAVEVRDEASLKAWLEGRVPGEAHPVSVRAALRVAPFLFLHNARPATVTLRLLLTLCLAPQRRTEAHNSSLAAAYRAFRGNGVPMDANGSPILRMPGEQIVFRCISAAVEARDNATKSAEAASHVMVLTNEGAILDFQRASLVADMARDAALIEAGGDAFGLPLWREESAAVWVRDAAERLRERGETWAFWADWYEGYLTGKPLDFDLLQKVAEIQPEKWDKGDDHVNAIIAAIRRDHAIARTPNGEVIAVNPDTGKLRIDVDTALPADIDAYARRKIRAAVGVFSLVHNQYSALAPDLHHLRQAADDPEYTPVELFDECAAASRRLGSRIRNGEVPEAEQDALISDYGHRIREAGADILANDPKTQEVLTARARITGTDALLEKAEAVRAGVDLLVPVTEGLLARRLPEDAAVATDPSADPEDRKVAGVKLASRYLRSAAAQVSLAGRAVVGTAKTLEAISVIRSSPVFQAALQAVYRYLGF